MNAIMRKAGRGSTLLVGTVALAFSLAACGGGGDAAEETTGGEDTAAEQTTEEKAEETTEADAAAEETTEEDAAAEETTEGDDAAAGATEVTDADLTAAKEQFIGFFTAASEGDYKAVCGYMLDPTTKEPMTEGPMLDGCASGVEGSLDPSTFSPEMVSMIDSMVEPVDNGDGTIGFTLQGTDLGMPMSKASDGKWYIDSGALMSSEAG
ncbi:hypothetical protein [Brachybacterium hainanense]|uniref:Uncharacterized protein n=1 Tax=Brachybacterium hainanense TaxID=1541174 RepID=A0ABV6RB76_9MICO